MEARLGEQFPDERVRARRARVALRASEKTEAWPYPCWCPVAHWAVHPPEACLVHEHQP